MKREYNEEELNENTIRVADFVVHSSTESLDKVKKVMDELIKKHKDFCALRINKKFLEDSNGII